MSVPSTQESARYWPHHPPSMPGQVASDSYSHSNTHSHFQPQPHYRSQTFSQPQRNDFDWLIGNLDAPARPAQWVKYPNKPHIEEFVPPNPPQALGAGRGKSLTWPTAAMCRTGQWTNANNIQKQVSNPNGSRPTGYESFFRRQMLKQNREGSENGRMKKEESPLTNDLNQHRGTSQDFWDLFDHDERSSSMGATPESYHARPSGISLGKRQRGQIGSLPPGCSTQRVMIHVQSSMTEWSDISSVCLDCDLPDNLTLQLPKLIQPLNPEQRKATLMTLTPMIVYAEFTCPDVCRTRGICVHFSFVLGCKKAPDGLICQICQNAGNEKAAHADRMCARHNNSKLSSFTMNLAEDILATETQSRRAHEILARSFTNNWDGVPARLSGKVKQDISGQNTSALPIRTIDKQAADCDVAVSSIETMPEHEEQVVKKVKVDAENGEDKLGGNAHHNANDPVETPMNLEQQRQPSIFGDTFAGDFETFLNDANQGFGDNNIW